MKKKGIIIGIIICTLLISVVALPVTGTLNQNIIFDKQFKNKENFSLAESDEDWWVMFRHDSGNTGCSSAIAPDTNELCWKQETYETIGIASPIVVEDKLYISTGEYYYIKQPELPDLQITHEKSIPLSNINKAMGTLNEDYYGTLYCLDAVTGTLLWDFYVGWSQNPAVIEGKVYVTKMSYYFYNSDIYCLDAETGNITWQKTIFGFILSSVIVADGRIYISALDFYDYSGRLYCLNAENGNPVWTHEMLPEEIMYYSSPAVADGMVYFITVSLSSYDYGTLYCLDAETGQPQWDQSIGYSEACSPAVANGKVYAVGFDLYSYNGGLYCFNANTGSPIWTFNLGSNQFTYSNPAVCDDSIYLPVIDYSMYYGRIYRIDIESGDKIWDVQLSGIPYYSSTAFADSKVYVPISDINGNFGKLLCLDSDDGNQIWSYTLDDITMASPAIADGQVYIPDCIGNIYAIGYPNDPPTPPLIDGPTAGKKGKSYDFTFVSTDPEGEDVYYFIYWGDGNSSGWIGSNASGQEVTLSHIWTEKGEYNISAKSKDIHNFESNWSIFKITITKSKTFFKPMSLEILERQILYFPLLERLYQLHLLLLKYFFV